MYGIRHVIDQDFPEYHAEIYRLKHNDPHFTQLLSEYDDTDKQIYGLEQQLQPVSDGYFSEAAARAAEGPALRNPATTFFYVT